MDEWFLKPFREAVISTFGWTGFMAGAMIVGFCAGYWIGHCEIVGPGETFAAFVLLPMIWIAFPQIIAAFVVMALAWYLPLHYDSLWLRLGAMAINAVVWLAVIASVVWQTDGAMFFRY